MRRARGVIGLFGAVLLAGAALAAEPMQEKIAPCLGCHGESGISQTEGVPSLGGQKADYIVTQLFQFREKQRIAPPMNDMAADLSDDDLRSYADALAALPAAVVGSPPADAALTSRMQALISKHQCNSCHGPELLGQEAIPRIRGQRQDYLAKALTGYKSNARPGYDPAMNEVAQELKEDEIRDLAAYIATL